MKKFKMKNLSNIGSKVSEVKKILLSALLMLVVIISSGLFMLGTKSEEVWVYTISVDTLNHNNYGLTYPVTYVFSIPNIQNLVAYKKYNLTEDWVRLPEKFKGELFNGIEAVRFDYDVKKAYVSVTFGPYSDKIYVKIADSSGITVPANFIGISDYYDNRKAVVACTIDDVGIPPTNTEFLKISEVFSNAQVWWTPAIVTKGSNVNWSVYQTGINMGFLEIASHSRNHPHVPYSNYTSEIGGSKSDIINNLDLPYKKDTKDYVWCWVEPFGESDGTVRQKLGEYKYLISRQVGRTEGPTFWAEWDVNNNHYSRALVSVKIDDETLEKINAAFDKAYANGGIYHIYGHVGASIGWNAGEKGYEHIKYIKGKTDIWYVGFGHLYVYHYTQKIISVAPPSVQMVETQLMLSVPSSIQAGNSFQVSGKLTGVYKPLSSYPTLKGAIEGGQIRLTASWGEVKTVTTDYNGNYQCGLTAPNTAGNYLITANFEGTTYFNPCQITASLSVIVASANLLENPSVEDDNDRNGIPDYWLKGMYGGAQASCIWVSDAHSGVKGVEITITYNPSVSQGSGAYWAQSTWKFAVGKTYKLRLWYKSSMNSAISLYAWSGSTVLKIVGLNLPTSSSWQQSGWIYLTVPAGTTHLTVYGRIFNQASGWVVFDDFELVEA